MKRAEVVVLSRAEDQITVEYGRYSDWDRAERFLRAIYQHLEYLESFPEIGRPFSGRYRKLSVAHYPYGIFYVIEGRRVMVVGVIFLGLNEQEIKRRLG